LPWRALRMTDRLLCVGWERHEDGRPSLFDSLSREDNEFTETRLRGLINFGRPSRTCLTEQDVTTRGQSIRSMEQNERGVLFDVGPENGFARYVEEAMTANVPTHAWDTPLDRLLCYENDDDDEYISNQRHSSHTTRNPRLRRRARPASQAVLNMAPTDENESAETVPEPRTSHHLTERHRLVNELARDTLNMVGLREGALRLITDCFRFAEIPTPRRGRRPYHDIIFESEGDSIHQTAPNPTNPAHEEEVLSPPSLAPPPSAQRPGRPLENPFLKMFNMIPEHMSLLMKLLRPR